MSVDRDPLETTIANFHEAEERGEAVDRDEPIERHEEHADSLRTFFSEHDQMKMAADVSNPRCRLDRRMTSRTRRHDRTIITLNGTKTEPCFDDDPSLLRKIGGIDEEPDTASSDRDHAEPVLAGTKPSPWGIDNLHGSLWEWCSDWWAQEHDSHSPHVDPLGATNGNFKVLRGGALEIYGRHARSGFRFFRVPDMTVRFRYHPVRTGARLVINLNPNENQNVTADASAKTGKQP